MIYKLKNKRYKLTDIEIKEDKYTELYEESNFLFGIFCGFIGTIIAIVLISMILL